MTTGSLAPAHPSSSHGSSSRNSSPFPPPPQAITPHKSSSRRRPILTFLRLLLLTLCIGISAGVLACTAHITGFISNTKVRDASWDGVIPGLWPEGMDSNGVRALLVGGAIGLAAGVLGLVMAVLPMPRRVALLILLTSTGLAIVALAGAVFGISYSAYAESRDDRETVRSWTCGLVYGARDANELLDGLSGLNAPEGFGRLCTENRVGFALLCALVGVQVLLVGVTGVASWLEVQGRRVEKMGLNAFGEKVQMY